MFRMKKMERGVRRRAALALAATAAAAALTLTGCSGGGDGAATPDLAAEQVLRFGFSSEPPTMSTTGGTPSTVSYQIYGLVHQGLMVYGEGGKVVPGLAESAQQTDDVTYTFELRPDLTFQDGAPLTSENVKIALEHYKDPANSARSYAGMKYIADIQTPTDTSVIVTLSSPNSSFLEFLADPSAFIAPAAAYEPEAEATVGAGPFEIVDWAEGTGITLKKFDEFYGADDVTLDEIDVSFYADGTARVNALLGGDVDMVDYLPWESFAQVEGTDGYAWKGEPGVFQSVLFNTADGPFTDPLVRQAIAYAVNRPNSVEAGFFGYAEPLDGIPGVTGDGEHLWDDDPDRAKELLSEAGYGEGDLTVTLLANSTYTFLQDQALSVQSDLEAIGINVDFVSPDWATFTQEAAAGNYDLMVQGNIGQVQNPAAWLPVLVQPPAAANKSFGFNNDELNTALSDALAATDDASREASLSTAYEIIQREVPFATLNQRIQAYGVSDRVQGFDVMPGFTQPYSVNNLIHVSMAD